MRDIFEKRVSFKKFEYPELEVYKKAIQQSYWLVDEFSFVGDIQDYHVKLTDIQRNAIKNTLLAISQIEVSVKKFWAKLGDRLPKAEVDAVGISYAECFAEGTEILTPNGWIDLANIKENDDVIQFHEDNTLSITKVLRKTEQDYSGPMYRFHKVMTEALVTPNHRVVYYDTKGRFKESVASELSVKRNIKIPEAGKLINDGLTALSYVERLRLALQADGNRRYYDSGYGKKLRKGDGIGAEYELRVKEPHKVTRMDWLIENLQDNPTIRITKAPIPSRPGFFCYTVRIDDEFDYKRFDWVNLYNKNYKWCLDFVDELREWDGSRPPGGKDCLHRFSSTVKDVSDKAQMVGVAAGFRTNLTVKPDDREESYLDNHYVSFTSNRERTSISSLKKESVEYEGKVWCVTVESGLVVTRYHGKTYVSGNSEIRHADAYSHILELLDLNDQFDIILQNPAIEGRVKYLSKYLAGAGDNSNQSFALTLAMFALLVESVSLFAQFLVIKSFDKKLHVLKGLDNTIQSTIREEQIHSLFGVKLLEIIKEENPDWFTEDNFYQKLYRASKKAYEAEEKIIEWIFEAGELDFLPMHVVKEFTKDRINKSLIMIGGNPVFEVDQTAMAEVLWFNEELLAEVNTDFFHKRPVAYSKFMQSYQAEDLF